MLLSVSASVLRGRPLLLLVVVVVEYYCFLINIIVGTPYCRPPLFPGNNTCFSKTTHISWESDEPHKRVVVVLTAFFAFNFDPCLRNTDIG